MTRRRDRNDEHEAHDEHEAVEDLDTRETHDDPDDRPWGAAAPVVTDEGIYGTLPDRQRVFREYQRQERPWRDTWVRLAGMAFAVIAGLWLVLLSASEATSEEAARPALESIMDTMTGLPDLLELHAEEITITGGDVAVPGYPLDVTIPDAAVVDGPERWREVILEESSALLYAEGPDALAGDADAEGAGTFSTSGGTKLLMSNLTQARHDSVSFLLWPLGVVALAAAAAIAVGGSSFGRFTALGLATAAAGVPSVALGLLSWAIVLFVGSDGSALAETGHEIAADLARVPLTNGVTFIVVGLVVAIAARVAGVFFPAPRRSIVQPAVEE